MNGAGALGAAGAQHLGRLAGEGRKQHIAIDILGEMPGQRGLAGAGVAEQPEHRRAAILEPARDGF